MQSKSVYTTGNDRKVSRAKRVAATSENLLWRERKRKPEISRVPFFSYVLLSFRSIVSISLSRRESADLKRYSEFLISSRCRENESLSRAFDTYDVESFNFDVIIAR